jgi:hypothetical protein
MARQSPPPPPAAGFELDPPSGFVVDVESASPELELEDEPEAELDDEPESPASAGFELLGVRIAARSFLAQPEPLKRIAGVVKPFFRVPSAPQAGQKRGVPPLIPWITSVRWPQLEQT